MPISDVKKKELFEKLKQAAIDNGFELLTPEWLGAKVEHQFRHIESGKEYWGRPKHILYGPGFPSDLRTDEDRYNELKQISKESSYELLTPKWLGVDVEHRFRHIASGEIREWKPDQIRSYGFPKDIRTDEDKYNALKRYSLENGFELLTQKWLGAKGKHQFRHIENGETGEWTPDQILRQGFPLVDSQRYVTQEVCRQAFAHIFGGEFKTNRERLKSRNGGQSMELDGYEAFDSVPHPLRKVSSCIKKDGAEVAFNLPIAFEFQGHENHREDEKTIARDKLKAKLCKEEGILLVQIDPTDNKFWNKVRDSDFMYAHICNAIQAAVGKYEEIDFPAGFEIDLRNWNPDKEMYEKLKTSAEKNGFELLTPEWLGAKVEHQFRHIGSGKEYWGIPDNILYTGFPKDINRYDDDHHYNKLKQKSMDSGFELLTPEWLGAKVEHQFRHIESGKEYWGIPNNILRTGFPNDLRTEEDYYKGLKQISKESGFELLTPKWLGARGKHRFRQIKTGEEYEGTPDQVCNRGFPKRFLKQDQPQPAQVSPTIITKRIATLNALTQPFRDGMNMVAGKKEDGMRARQRPAG